MTSQPLPDRWASRDFPVLVAAARRLEDTRLAVMSHELIPDTGLEHDDIGRALSALVPAYLDGRSEGGLAATPDFIVTGLTERGRRTVGLWPSGESADALIDALRQAEDLVDDLEEKSHIRRAAGAVGAVSRDVMVDVLAAVVARQSGLG